MVLVRPPATRSAYRALCKLTILFKICRGQCDPQTHASSNSVYQCKIPIENVKCAYKLGIIFQQDGFLTLNNILRYC